MKHYKIQKAFIGEDKDAVISTNLIPIYSNMALINKLNNKLFRNTILFRSTYCLNLHKISQICEKTGYY